MVPPEVREVRRLVIEFVDTIGFALVLLVVCAVAFVLGEDGRE